MSLASFMMPVRPRRYLPNIGNNKDLERIVKNIAIPFALWSLQRPHTSIPKVYVNNSIVIVGASRTGLAFLETLLLGQTSLYLTFTHITLVSQHGLPTVAEGSRAAETCVPQEGRYNDRYLKSVPFYYYVDVMSAVMIQIDRKKKCIHLKGGGVKFYDELVLTCGQQFQHPEYLKDSIKLAKEVEQGKPCNRILMDNPKYEPEHVPLSPDIPSNVMLINSLYEANICLRNLKRMISDTQNTSRCLSSENQIIVYGDCIEAYTCISALMELGISSQMITFVEPFPPMDSTSLRINCFNDETVDERVQASIEKLGIRTYRKCHYAGWSQRGSQVNFMRLMAPLHAIHLQCFAIFYYGIKAIDLNAFKAINESGLVYDGGLVVGPRFETNDPCVWAAGPCVRYSRRLYAPRELHRYYCSEDVGEELARQFLKKLNPFETGSTDDDVEVIPSEILRKYNSSLFRFHSSHASISSGPRSSLSSRWQPVQRFESPIVVSATLPGQLYYMKLRKPGQDIPMAVQLILPSQGHTLITDKSQNYFRLQMNSLHCIESITCLSRRSFSCETLTQLYGKHEAYFNNLLARYMMNLIDDLYGYFSKSWTAALYQEPFVELLKDIYDHGGNTVYDVVKSKYYEFYEEKNDSLRETGSDELMIINDCKECGQNKSLRNEAALFWKSVGGDDIVSTHLTRYLHKHTITNPHYAKPEHQQV